MSLRFDVHHGWSNVGAVLALKDWKTVADMSASPCAHHCRKDCQAESAASLPAFLTAHPTGLSKQLDQDKVTASVQPI